MGSPGDFQWSQVSNIWDHFQDFEVDQAQSSMMQFSSNIIPLDHCRQDVTLSNGFQEEPPISATSRAVIQSLY